MISVLYATACLVGLGLLCRWEIRREQTKRTARAMSHLRVNIWADVQPFVRALRDLGRAFVQFERAYRERA